MTDDGGEGLDVHAVFQRCGCESVPQIVKLDVLAVGPFQYSGQPFTDSGGISGGSLFSGERNIHAEFISFL